LKEYYRKAKLFVMATKSGEALMGSDCPGQTSVLDTLAYGMPMVATESKWFDGYFENGKELIWVEAGNAEALKEAIKKVSSDPELALRLSREGRKTIEEKCNSEEMGKRTAEIILGIA
jgi:glycosyltransferase involved in cell wall biosynthesis